MHQIQGDPDFVASEAAAIIQAAQTMVAAVNQLNGIVDGEERSKAIAALKTNVTQLVYVLNESSERYGRTGEALKVYAPVLRESQTEVNAAMSAAGHTDVDGARARDLEAEAHAVATNANPFASPHDRELALHDLQQAKQHLADQTEAVAAAQRQYDTAIETLDAAAQVAIGQIDSAIAMSKLNDTFGDQIRSVGDHLHGLLSKLLSVLHRILSDLSAILSAIAAVLLVLAIVTGFPGFAAAAVLVGRAATAVALVDLAVQAIRYVIGDISFGEFAVDAIFTAAGLLLGGLAGKATLKYTVTHLGPKLLTDLEKEAPIIAGESHGFDLPISEGLNRGQNATENPLARFIDDHNGNLFTAHNDIDQLTPDFSHINLDRIMGEAGLRPTVLANPLPASTYVASVA